jgi:hypothetical protein
MAGKSRRRRGKYAYEEKLRKRNPVALGTESVERSTPQTPPTAAPRPVAASSVATAGTKATAFAAKNLHVGDELRRIGLITGIIVAVLVVLAFTLP